MSAARAAEMAGDAGVGVAELKQPSSPTNTYMLVPILLLFVLLIIAVLRAPSLISNAGIGSAIIVAAPLILATYALTVIAMAGRAGVDLSIGPLLGFLNVSMIQLHAAGVITTPVEFFAYAIAVGVLYQILFGLIVVFVRVQPIIVALSGFLALVGLNLVILPRPGGVAPEWLMPWGLGTSVLSPVLAIVVIATIAWFFLVRTAFFGHLRLMGADERTAYSAGVRIGIVRIGAHVVAGVYSALAAITFTALIGSGDPTQGTTYTLMAVTALVLGGTSLAGGRGTIIGSLLGALNIYLITYVLSTFSFGMVQSFVTELAYGVVLVVSLLLTLLLPRLPLQVRSISPFAFFVVVGVVALGVILYAKDEIIAPAPEPAGGGITVLGAAEDGGGVTVLGGDAGVTVLGGDDTGAGGATVLGADEPNDAGVTVLGGDDAAGSGVTVLGGEADSGITVLGAEPATGAPPARAGTALVIAAVIVAFVLYLLYLLYRHVSVPLVAFVGIVILLVLGITLYDRMDPSATSTRTIAPAAPAPLARVFAYETTAAATPAGTETAAATGSSVFSSPLAYTVLVVVGAILVSSFLIFLAVHHVRTRIRDVPLVLYLALAVAVCGIIVYAYDSYPAFNDAFYAGALGALVVGALLFIMTLPSVEARVGNVTHAMLAAVGLTALGAMYFAAGPAYPPAGVDAAALDAAHGGTAAAAPAGDVVLPDAFHTGVFWVVLAGAALFLAALPRVWRFVLHYISFDQGIRALSYTGVFIVVFAVLGLSALFYAAGVPLWKLGVAVLAAVIGARFAWRFLADYRRDGGSESSDETPPLPRSWRQGGVEQ